MKKWMNQPHYHKHGWAKYDEAQAAINELKKENKLLLEIIEEVKKAVIDKHKEGMI